MNASILAANTQIAITINNAAALAAGLSDIPRDAKLERVWVGGEEIDVPRFEDHPDADFDR